MERDDQKNAAANSISEIDSLKRAIVKVQHDDLLKSEDDTDANQERGVSTINVLRRPTPFISPVAHGMIMPSNSRRGTEGKEVMTIMRESLTRWVP